MSATETHPDTVRPTATFASIFCPEEGVFVNIRVSDDSDTSAESRDKMQRARVLLADDHDAVLTNVTEALAPHYDVIGAVRDGASLVEAATSLNPDVLVVDISMPILNGIQAVARIKHGGSRAKVVFLTVHEGDDFVQACFAVGATGYVVKPRLVSDLVFAINEVLAERSFVSPSMTARGGP